MNLLLPLYLNLRSGIPTSIHLVLSDPQNQISCYNCLLGHCTKDSEPSFPILWLHPCSFLSSRLHWHCFITAFSLPLHTVFSFCYGLPCIFVMAFIFWNINSKTVIIVTIYSVYFVLGPAFGIFHELTHSAFNNISRGKWHYFHFIDKNLETWSCSIAEQVMSNSFVTPWTAAPARLFCLTLSPRVCSSSCSLNLWYYLIISSSAARFFCIQSFWSSIFFPMSRFFTSGGQSIGASVWALPMIFRVDFL